MIAPMLSKLGYDPEAYPPEYGQADNQVQENTKNIRDTEEYWRKRKQDIQNMSKPPRNYAFEPYDAKKDAGNGKVKPADGYNPHIAADKS